MNRFMKNKLTFSGTFLLLNLCTLLPLGAYTLSGYINYSKKVTVTLSGDAAAVTTTDSNGYYAFTDLQPGSYRVTPSKPYTQPWVMISIPDTAASGNIDITITAYTDYCGYGFSPSSIAFAPLESDQENQNFQTLLTACCFSITNVDYYIDDVLVYSDSTERMSCTGAEYTWTWDTTSFPTGSHTIKVIVTDGHMGTGSLQMRVMVDNPIAKQGDVNRNGSVDIIDALLVAQYYVGLNPAGFHSEQADTNCNGAVDIIDALLIAQYYVGLITQFCG